MIYTVQVHLSGEWQHHQNFHSFPAALLTAKNQVLHARIIRGNDVIWEKRRGA